MSSEVPDKGADLARADASWNEWRTFLDREAAAGRGHLRGADGWTLAEVAAHVARWQGWAVSRLRSIQLGHQFEKLDVDGQNAGWAAEDHGVSLDAALERLDRAWAALRVEAESIPEARWRRVVAGTFAANTWEHYEEHQGWRPEPPAA